MWVKVKKIFQSIWISENRTVPNLVRVCVLKAFSAAPTIRGCYQLKRTENCIFFPETNAGTFHLSWLTQNLLEMHRSVKFPYQILEQCIISAILAIIHWCKKNIRPQMDNGLQYILGIITFITSVHMWRVQFQNRNYDGNLSQDRENIVCD